ncbi:MAG TPA: hypothetical protein PKH51_07580, partial [Candidatus Sumerlaeota bacterium]|nr:hypothetical protein [Candidatus Sumerlaeota bacterium]
LAISLRYNQLYLPPDRQVLVEQTALPAELACMTVENLLHQRGVRTFAFGISGFERNPEYGNHAIRPSRLSSQTRSQGGGKRN